eukprot:COSAG06_NODE_5688_length_3318_cov_88.976390_3_plen_352_part_00
MDYLVAVMWALGAMSDSTDADAAHGAPSVATSDGVATSAVDAVLPPSRGDGWRDKALGPLSGLGGSSDKLRAKAFDPSGSLVGASSAQARADKPRKEAMECPNVMEQMRMVMLLVAVALAVARAPHVMALKALGLSSVNRLFTFGPVGMALAVPIGLLCVRLATELTLVVIPGHIHSTTPGAVFSLNACSSERRESSIHSLASSICHRSSTGPSLGFWNSSPPTCHFSSGRALVEGQVAHVVQPLCALFHHLAQHTTAVPEGLGEQRSELVVAESRTMVVVLLLAKHASAILEALAQPGETTMDHGEQVGSLGEDGRVQVYGCKECILAARPAARVQAEHECLVGKCRTTD